ncbi:MAG: uroporphyrinogen-III synthase [Desulfovibrionaceae bacterium]|nr:uroporphyrinogen-III synthase [Desulfovibrionaceae bacterium]
MKILVSQKTPANLNAFKEVEDKYGATVEFCPFFLIEPLSAREFRAERINLPDYTAIVFSSRHAIDAYFKLCEEMRFKVPETMKYFCTTELVALYLLKHVVYRKRKIFFGDGTPQSVVSLIGPKHKGERFLITTSEDSNASSLTTLFQKAGLNYTVSVMVKSVSQDISGLDLSQYGALVLYNHHDLISLKESFPDFKQGNLAIISYGRSIATELTNAGFEIAVQGPSAEVPSAAKAIDIFLSRQ